MKLSEQLATLNAYSTPGQWGQFSVMSGPWKELAGQAYRDRKVAILDTSHHISAVTNDTPRRVAEFKHSDDAAFAEALVNAYRNGHLTVKEDVDV